MIPLTERVVVITGASSGIGAALARESAKRGAKVVVAARRLPELRAVADECGGDGGALAVACDVTKHVDVQRLVDEALGKFGAVDVWVNNAGIGISRSIEEITDEDFDVMMSANVKSALYGMQAVLPHMKAKKRGHVINVSSMLGRVPFAPARAMYSASKAALSSISTSMRMAVQIDCPDVWITTAYPGVVATEFGVNARHGGMDNRKIPGAQPVDEVVGVLVDCMENPRAEVFTRPEYRKTSADYHAADVDLADLEKKPPFRR